MRWNPAQHPRDRRGRFARVLGGLGSGKTVELPNGVRVRRQGETFHVERHGRPVQTDSASVASVLALPDEEESKEERRKRMKRERARKRRAAKKVSATKYSKGEIVGHVDHDDETIGEVIDTRTIDGRTDYLVYWHDTKSEVWAPEPFLRPDPAKPAKKPKRQPTIGLGWVRIKATRKELIYEHENGAKLEEVRRPNRSSLWKVSHPQMPGSTNYEDLKTAKLAAEGLGVRMKAQGYRQRGVAPGVVGTEPVEVPTEPQAPFKRVGSYMYPGQNYHASRLQDLLAEHPEGLTPGQLHNLYTSQQQQYGFTIELLEMQRLLLKMQKDNFVERRGKKGQKTWHALREGEKAKQSVRKQMRGVKNVNGMVKSVSKRINPDQRQAIDSVLQRAAKLHGFPRNARPIKFGVARRNSVYGEYRGGIGPEGGTMYNPEINLNAKDHANRAAVDTVIHELGHYLDDMMGQALDSNPYSTTYATDRKSSYAPIGDVMRAIGSTQAARELRMQLEVHQAGVYSHAAFRGHKRYLQYLTSDKEFFARAYAQYIATKMARDGDSSALEVLKDKIERRQVPLQWSDEDFQPIERAFDNLFREIATDWERAA